MSSHLVPAADALGTAIALIEAIDMAAAGAMDMDDQERSALRTLASVAGDTTRRALGEIESPRAVPGLVKARIFSPRPR